MPLSQNKAEELGRRYTEAWCSHDPDAVASFYAPDGKITINDGEPSIGRSQVAEMARGFYDSFPDLILRMDSIRTSGTYCVYQWTLEGTNPALMERATGLFSVAGNIGACPMTGWFQNQKGILTPRISKGRLLAAEASTD
jgi:uncharacterized protein (TIGR02246 family)